MSESNVKYTEAEALEFHARGRPGKVEIIATKPMATQRDLALAYSPGVAVPVRAIADNPDPVLDQLLDVARGRGMKPHADVHRRGDDHGLVGRQ